MGRGLVLILADEEGPVYSSALEKLEESCLSYPLAGEATPYLMAAADLAIIDCHLQVGQGLQLLQVIKQQRPGTPVVFITAASSEETVLQALRSGAREYFKKPVDHAELLNSVATILSLKRNANWTHLPSALINSKGAPGRQLPCGELPERLLRAIYFIDRHLSSRLSLKDIAQEACLSKYHFSRLFKHYLGLTPIQFILNLRLCRAMDLIRGTDLAITAVAERTGFNDLSDFYRQFKKMNGMAPSVFRTPPASR